MDNTQRDVQYSCMRCVLRIVGWVVEEKLPMTLKAVSMTCDPCKSMGSLALSRVLIVFRRHVPQRDLEGVDKRHETPKCCEALRE